jgi:hypothetical protein
MTNKIICCPNNSIIDGCVNLKKIQEIERNAFNGCERLVNIVLNEGLISIGNKSFTNCNNLKNICFPNSVREIGK